MGVGQIGGYSPENPSVTTGDSSVNDYCEPGRLRRLVASFIATATPA
jgi:hypothetical protein